MLNENRFLVTFSCHGKRSTSFKLVYFLLADRTQQVLMNNCLSDPLPIKSGAVPQGSIL